jgi:two-component system cell cycle sensor histidine kinase/response regulator CckA
LSVPDLAGRAAPEATASGIGELLQVAAATVRELLSSCAPNDPLHPRLQQVQQTMARLTALTGPVVVVPPIKGGCATPLDLNTVVREMTAPLQRLLGPFITLETEFHLPGLWAAVDRCQIEQAALGLLINAREALPLGGTVRLATRQWVVDQPTQYRVGVLPAGVWSALEVRDNGAGVDERSMRHLLDRSVHGVPFHSTLSLSTVSAIVSGAGGHVILDMPSRGGTVLAACLPTVPPPRSRQPATGTANAILIVDEDEWTRMSAARTLRHAGFGVLEARNANDALELLDDVAGSCVRLMIVDANLLSGDSSTFGDRVRRERPEVHLLVTAVHRSSTGGYGQAPILTKPFSPDDLLRAVRERLTTTALPETP